MPSRSIPKTVNLLHGLINAVEPTSPAYPEGAAWVSDNSRLDKEGVWNKGPVITTNASGATARTVPGKTGNHFKPIAISGSQYIADGLGNTDTIAQGPNGYGYYLDSGTVKSWDGTDNSGSDTAGLARPTTDPAASTSGTGTRQEGGIYWYMYTLYDASRNVESLPSDVIEHYVRRYYSGDTRQADVPNITGTVPDLTGSREDNVSVRWYRSKVIRIYKGDTRQLGQESIPTEFYFLGESAAGSGEKTWVDYAHDNEIARPENRYTGRGSAPPSSDVIADFNNRLFCFKDNAVHFSSSGRPEEVPQEYTLTVNLSYSEGNWTAEVLNAGSETLTLSNFRPILDTGLEGAVKFRVPELKGETVKAAETIGDKLWVWTEHTTGYIVPTAKYDGYKYIHVADGIGVCSPHTIQNTPYGIFGADRKGIWQITDTIQRLSYGRIDIDTSGKSTYLNYSSYAAASFGVWVNELNEYWWSFQTAATPTYAQIAYQADMQRFVGPYKLAITGGCSFTSSGGTQCYLTGGKTPTISADRDGGGAQLLKFWVGQETITYVKDMTHVYILYTSVTADKDVTAKVYQNNIASETNATESQSVTHNDSNLIGYITPVGSGRLCEIYLSIPTDCTAPIAAINYAYELVPLEETASR